MGEIIRRTGRILIFLIALGAVVALIVMVARALRQSPTVGVSVCGLRPPESVGAVALETYIQMHAEELAQPAGDDDTPVTFVIEPGQTAVDIGTRLEEAGLVSSGELFRRYLQYQGLDSALEAGTYTLRQTMTIPEIAQALQRAQRQEQTLVIREGLRLEEIAAQVAAQTNVSEADFLALVTSGWRSTDLVNYEFLAALPPTATLEGFLFPDTYRLPEEATAYDVVSRMIAAFDERIAPATRQAAAAQGLSVYEMVTLASIVEREAVLASERPLIASVYLNRLRAGWLLAADPTVQYGLGYDEATGTWWRRLYFDTLGITSLAEIDHPYNTYRYAGLPPGPICSPGQASIEGVAFPAASDYYYFIANCHASDGSHLFAVTEEEHYANFASCSGTAP